LILHIESFHSHLMNRNYSILLNCLIHPIPLSYLTHQLKLLILYNTGLFFCSYIDVYYSIYSMAEDVVGGRRKF
jgi:hypothetical protein